MRDVIFELHQRLTQAATQAAQTATALAKKVGIYDFCMDDKKAKNYPFAMNGVYHDSTHQMAVASDAQILLATKDDYRPECACKIIDRNGNEMDGHFVKWETIIPIAGDIDKVLEVDVSKMEVLLSLLKEKKKEWQCKKDKIHAIIYLGGKMAADVERLYRLVGYTTKWFYSERRGTMWYQNNKMIAVVSNRLVSPLDLPVGTMMVRTDDDSQYEILKSTL